jgi:DNA mismatch endonuclease, patch repair protein
MASIHSENTRPERLLRSALWSKGIRGFRCHWPGPSGRIDVAFTRWRVAIFVDGSFWHGHPSKWQPGRWNGYWDEKIKRNIARDERQNTALIEAGWRVLRFWDFEVEHDSDAVAEKVRQGLEIGRLSSGN